MIREALNTINERGWTVKKGLKDIKKELQLVLKKDTTLKQSIKIILRDIDDLDEIDTTGLIESLDEGIFDFFKKADKKHKVSKKTTAEDDVNHILTKIDKVINDAEYEGDDGTFIEELEYLRIKISNLFKWK